MVIDTFWESSRFKSNVNFLDPKRLVNKNLDSQKQENNEESGKEIPSESKNQNQQSSWRSWGAFGMISSASKTVASITTQVSQSISTAIESINIPEPEEMAKRHADQNISQSTVSDKTQDIPEESESVFKFDSILSNVSSISSKVVTGGLDTLEGIGKKTINILQDTDPNIKDKFRSIQTGNKLNLSELLKEAKENSHEGSEITSSLPNDNSLENISFEQLLDDCKGVVFLEALEILSQQSKLKIELLLKPLTGKILLEMEETLSEVEELCELPDSDSNDDSTIHSTLNEKLKKATEDLNIEINFTEIISHSKDFNEWIEAYDERDEICVYKKSLEVLAKICALSLNNYQKLAELMLSLSHRSTADEADAITQ